MAYRKPPALVHRVFNPIALRLGLAGTAALSVAGRKTGQPRRVPVLPFEHQGARYVLSTRGEAEWVRNLRAAGKAELRRKGVTEQLRASEVPVTERPPIIDAYRKAAGRAVATYFTSLPDPADHPVFRLEPLDG